MQTEEMKRLLKKDDKSPSRYRISGYLLTITYKTGSGVYYCNTLKPYRTIGDLFDNWKCISVDFMLEFDAFELGIKIGDEWIFGEWTATQYGSHYFKHSKIKG